MAQLTPIVNAGIMYVRDMRVVWNSNTSLSVLAGQCRDSNNVIDMSLSATQNINPTISGLNGLDTGTVAASTFYYVYVVGSSANDAPTSVILSANASKPLLPFGYDSFRLISYQLTNGSSQLLRSYELGRNSDRMKVWDTIIAAASAPGTTTLSLLSLANGVPPIEVPVYLSVNFTAATPGDSIFFANSTSGSTGPYVGIGGPTQTQQIKVASQLVVTVAQIRYKNTSASDSQTISIYGFDYFL